MIGGEKTRDFNRYHAHFLESYFAARHCVSVTLRLGGTVPLFKTRCYAAKHNESVMYLYVALLQCYVQKHELYCVINSCKILK